MTLTASNPAPRRAFRTRTRAVLAGVAIALLALGGAGSAWAGVEQNRGGGYFGTSAARLSSPTGALVTREIDVGASGGHAANPSFDIGDLSNVRIRATSGHPDQPLFIGIGPVDDVLRYLRGTSYDEMQSFTTDPLRVVYARSGGSTVAAPPADQHFWVASRTGRSTLDLRWNKRGGAWAAVAMNADGSPGVVVTADIGLRFGFLLPLGLGLLTVAALALVAVFLRRRRRPAGTSIPSTPVLETSR